MKRFRFSLESVLSYKQQELDAKKTEHAAALAAMRRQEEALARVEEAYAQLNQEYREKKATGLMVVEALSFENGLRRLEEEIAREEQRLAEARSREAEKRQRVVEAKQDTSSLEKLREHKLDSYKKEQLKSEEAFIDELVSASWAAGRQAARA